MTASTSADTLRLASPPVLARAQQRCARVPSCPTILGVESIWEGLLLLSTRSFSAGRTLVFAAQKLRQPLARLGYETAKEPTTDQSP